MLFYGTPILYFELYDVWPHQVGVTCISSQTISSEISDMVSELSHGESDDSASADEFDSEEDYHRGIEKQVHVTMENDDCDFVFGNFNLDAMPLDLPVPIKPKSDGSTIKIGEVTCFLITTDAAEENKKEFKKIDAKEKQRELDLFKKIDLVDLKPYHLTLSEISLSTSSPTMRSLLFTHPTSFMVTMVAELQNKVKCDLNLFLKSKQYYDNIERVWKRNHSVDAMVKSFHVFDPGGNYYSLFQFLSKSAVRKFVRGFGKSIVAAVTIPSCLEYVLAASFARQLFGDSLLWLFHCCSSIGSILLSYLVVLSIFDVSKVHMYGDLEGACKVFDV